MDLKNANILGQKAAARIARAQAQAQAQDMQLEEQPMQLEEQPMQRGRGQKRKPEVVEQEEKISIEKSNEKHSRVVKIEQCITYKSSGGLKRYFCIVPVPRTRDPKRKKDNTYYLDDKTNTWYVGDGYFYTPYHPSLQFPKGAENCGFYYSTGTSNELGANFPGMWFPFYGIKTRKYDDSKTPIGWIHKASGLRVDLVMRYLESKGLKITEEADKKTLNFFLEKFNFWWQIQISATLPQGAESLFNTNQLMMQLKGILLSNIMDYNGLIKDVDNQIVTYYDLDTKICQKIEESDDKSVNSWLIQNNALTFYEIF